MSWRAGLLIGAVLLVSACAAPSEREQSDVTASTGLTGQLEALAVRLPGRYGAPRRLDQDRPGSQMRVSVGSAGNASLLLEIREEHEDRQRGFILTLAAGGTSPFIPGRFVPLQADGTPSAHSCAMRFRIRDGLLSGETDPGQCRFGTGEAGVGLLKEVALDGNRIVIADQLTGPGGSGNDAPDILRLFRLDGFRGQVRVRTGPDAGWRTSQRVQARVGGNPVEPLDAADMSLGVQIRLELIEGQQPGTPLLYLQLADARSGTILGQAWGDPRTERLGLALDGAQVDLEKR